MIRYGAKSGVAGGSPGISGKPSGCTFGSSFLRKYRMDEFPQLFNILAGDMTLVGTRPEVPKYVKKYTKEMYATLLLPAGLTSRTSIAYKDEDKLLGEAVDEKSTDNIYLNEVLPCLPSSSPPAFNLSLP